MSGPSNVERANLQPPTAQTNFYFDISSINAVDSMFSKGKEMDLWAPKVLGRFANILIYGERASFPLPTLSKDMENFSSNKKFEQPFLEEIRTFGGQFLKAIPFNSEDVDTIDVSRMPAAFDTYYQWARRKGNIPLIKSFLGYHNTPDMRNRHRRTVGKRQMLNIRQHVSARTLQGISKVTGISEEGHLYCFDVVFRYPIYGNILCENQEIAGPNAAYYHHPIRNAFSIPEMSVGKESVHLNPKISFAPTFEKAAKRFTMEEFLETTKILRELSHRYGLYTTSSRDVGIETLREMATAARLPARFRKPSSLVSDIIKLTISALVGKDIGSHFGNPLLGALGGLFLGSSLPITIAKDAWTKRNPLLPKYLSDKTWLRPILTFDLEDQIR